MDTNYVVAAGPSNIPRPPPVIESHAPDPRHQSNRKRPKRKRIASEAGGSIAGETADGSQTGETWSMPWLEGMGPTSSSQEKRLHDEIVAFFNYMAPSPEERGVRDKVIAELAQVVKRRFPKSSLDTYGSVAQNLYLPDGDTDLVITTPHPYDDDTKTRALFQLAALLRNSYVTAHVQVIHRARVPVISFQTLPDLGSLKTDMSINAADGVQAVPILREYFDRMPALRFLVICIKSLLSRHNLNTASAGGLSSYGVICLAIHYLQTNPQKLPAELIEDPLKNGSLGRLLMDFLDYYGSHFPYDWGVVSVTQGKIITKNSKGWIHEDRQHYLCIECILHPDKDVGKPTSKIAQIIARFQAAYSSLKSYAFPDSASAPNVLGTILGVSDSTLAHRRLLKEIVVSGRFDHALLAIQGSSTVSSGYGARRPSTFSLQQNTSRQNMRPYGDDHRDRDRDRDHGRDRERDRDRARLRPSSSSLPPPPPSLPPRPNLPGSSGRYVAQGPSIGAMRAGAKKPNSLPETRSPPRRRRKA